MKKYVLTNSVFTQRTKGNIYSNQNLGQKLPMQQRISSKCETIDYY